MMVCCDVMMCDGVLCNDVMMLCDGVMCDG